MAQAWALGVVPAGTPLVAAALLAGATAMSAATAVVMARDALRARSSQGLALGTLVLSAITYPLWLAYGAGHGNYLQVACNVAWMAAVSLWWGFRATDRGQSFWPSFLWPLLWAAALAGCVVAGFPYAALGWAATVAGVVANVPQAYALVRGTSLGAGVSVAGWVLVAVQQVLWLGYALGGSDLPVAVGTAISLLVNAAIACRILVLRRRRHEPSAVVP